MAIPPPPPPGPPPPPAFKLNLGGGGGGGGSSGGGDPRNALLQSIQKGAKLKKTVTNDKSGPAIAGRVAGAGGSSSSNVNQNNSSHSSNSNGERRAAPGAPGSAGGGGGSAAGGPKLGGIFGGMSEMPKLKPVNRGPNTSTLNRSPPKTSNANSSGPASLAGNVDQQNTSISSSSSNNSSISNISSSNNNSVNGGALDFNTELTQHLTLKKKKLQQQQQQSSPPQTPNVTEANLKTNRGPPPQPPPPATTTTTTTTTTKNPPAPPPPPINGIAANSSSLFGGNSNGTIPPPPPPIKSQPVPRGQVIVKIITMEGTNQINTNSNTASDWPLMEPMVNHNHASVVIPIMGGNGGMMPNKSSLFTSVPPQTPLPSRTGSFSNADPFANPPTTNSISSSSAGQDAAQQQMPTTTVSVSEMKRLLSQTSATTATPTSPKPSPPSYGKPNLAPKPPGANGSTPTSPLLTSPGLVSNRQPTTAGIKATVARHHSMKTPRSPPVAPAAPGAPVFPSQNHFGTMRGAPQQQYQSQETISSQQAPSNGRPIGRPTVAPPPRPPPNKPPPPPLRSVSNQNLPQMPLSTPTQNTLNSAASANNVSVLKEQLKHHIGNGGPIGGGSTPNVEKVVNGGSSSSTNGNGVAPPLPPHRTCPAPPPPNANRQQSNLSTSSSTNSAPPVPPQRHSSIRSVSQVDSGPIVAKTVTPNGMSSINRIIVDLESKFADRFHNPTEFPKPAPFFRTEKHYPSLTRAKNVAESRKQRAPKPPGTVRAPIPLPTTTATTSTRAQAPLPPLPVAEEECDKLDDPAIGSQQCFIQLTDNKLFANESSNC